VVRQLIVRAARRHGVPTSLALALAYQESGFQQRVVSSVDAIGAMQVLPSTGRALARLHGRPFDLLKASDNVEAGVLLLRDLLQAAGSVDKALAGYYQGLGSLARIGPLPQTKLYVRNVKLLRSRFS
jgi:soluble lytic murein transglycosylase-like protein